MQTYKEIVAKYKEKNSKTPKKTWRYESWGDSYDDSPVDGYGEGRLDTIPKTWLKTMPELQGLPNPETRIQELATGGVATPKRGLVDGPGSYSQDKTYYEKNKEKILKKLKEKRFDPEKSKVKIKKAENVEAWKKANPDLDFDSLFDSMKTRIRQGDLTAGTFQQKTPGIYTIQELAKVEGMPFADITLQNAFTPYNIKNKKQSRELLEAFKNAGIEKLPKTKQGQPQKYKMLNPKESMEKLIDYALTTGGKPPKKLVEPYKKQIPIEYKKLVKLGKPFSIENLRIEVLKALPENVYKLSEGSFNAMIEKALTEKQRNKFIRGNILTRTENLQPRKIIIDNILDGKTNIKQLANASNLSEKRSWRANFKNFYNNISI
jgi:hypothetical protein